MSTRTMMGLVLFGFSCLLAAGSLACSGAPEGEGTGESEAAVAKGGGGGTVGSACTVTDSYGHTHSGTYTNDVDGLNCAGPWGSVNCTNQGVSNGRCKNAATTAPPGPTPAPVPTVIKLG